MSAAESEKAAANGAKNPKSQKTDSCACVRGLLAFRSILEYRTEHQTEQKAEHSRMSGSNAYAIHNSLFSVLCSSVFQLSCCYFAFALI